MNRPNIKTLIAHLSQLDPERFNMDFWVSSVVSTYGQARHDCGTAACIGGWTELLFAPPAAEIDLDEIEITAADHLGLTDDQAQALFTPNGRDWSQITPAEAVQTLQRLLDTGEVVW